MLWMLLALLLVPFVGLPMLRLVLLPRRAAPAIPWIPIGIGLALVVWVAMSFGNPGKSPDPAPAYAASDTALRALIE